MKTLKKSFRLFISFSLLFPAVLIGQNFEDFQKSVLVDIPGDNYDFDLLSGGIPYPVDDLYITWVNKTDSVYTIYLKKVTPETPGSDIIITSDNFVKSNPEIEYNSSGPGITIVWENFTGSFYQIVRCDYSDGSLSGQVILKDSLNDDPRITMSYDYLAWVADSSLYLRELFPDTSSPDVIDIGIGSPCLVRDDFWDSPPLPLLYEKSVNGNSLIYLAIHQMYPAPHWEYSELSYGYNPDFGIGRGISFEIEEAGVNRIMYYPYTDPEANFFISENTACNYKNPDIFSYPVPTNRPDEDTPFFIVFDTDSLQNNNEVMIQTAFYWPDTTLINISDMEGEDCNPKADLMLQNNIAYVVIVWEHNDGVHRTIWMSKTIFQPAGGVKEDGVNLGSFDLLQNYPNPFNPVTHIEYTLKQGTDVKVTVYDILGDRIATLVDRYEYAGKHKVVFDGRNLSSGIYIYTIEVNRLRKTKAMILLR